MKTTLEMINMKICSKCKIEKEFEAFYKNKTRKDGLNVECKQCCADRQRLNKEKTNAKTARWRRAHKEEHNAAVRSWRKRYPERQAKSSKIWRDNNPDYEKNRKKIDPVYKIACNLRRRINHIIKDDYKAGSAIKDLGCTPEELKEHLENQFQEGMTWENYGPKGWHIDHKMPLSKFNLEIKEEFLAASHYTNLQPMWAEDNLSKGNKL